MMLMLAGAVRLWSGRTDEAVDVAERGLAAFSTSATASAAPRPAAMLGRALVTAGRVEEGLGTCSSTPAATVRRRAVAADRRDGSPSSRQTLRSSVNLSASGDVADGGPRRRRWRCPNGVAGDTDRARGRSASAALQQGDAGGRRPSC